MSRFTGPLTLTHLDADWRRWRLEQPLSFEVDAIGSGRFVIVPPGFVSDGASVPRPLWWLLPAWGRYSRAAVVHDYLWQRIDAGEPHEHAPTRRRADAIFLDAMRACGVKPWVRWLMWAAVRCAAPFRRGGG